MNKFASIAQSINPIVARVFFSLVMLLSSINVYADVGVWETKAPMNTARYGATSGVINGKFYVVGGYANGSIQNVLEVYNPVTNTWSNKAPPPTPRLYAGSGIIDGKLYVAGGTGNAITNVVSGVLEVYDPVTDTWTTKASMPSPVLFLSSSMGVVSGKLYVPGGGLPSSSPRNTLQVYDPTTNTWSLNAPMLTARYDTATGTIDNMLYVAGGWNGSTNTGTLESYDPNTNRWFTEAPMPTARQVPGVGVIAGRLYVAGGWDRYRFGTAAQLQTLEIYDPLYNIWVTGTPAMPTGRQQPSAGVIGGQLYVAGGYNDLALTTLEVYTPPLSISPESLDFGTVSLASVSLPQTVTVTNNGKQPFLSNSLVVIGANPSDFVFSLDNCSSVTLAPATNCSFAVAFKPTISGSRSALIQITDGTAANAATVTLSGNGTTSSQGNPILSVTLPDSLASLDFGSIAINTSKKLSCTVTNTGGGTLTGNATTSSPFSIIAPDSYSLAAGASQPVVVRFSPTSIGSAFTNVKFSAITGNDVSITAKGVGTDSLPNSPFLILSTNILSFGEQAVAGASAEQTITITNTGNSNLEFEEFALPLTDFVHSADTCSSPGYLLPQESCSYSVVFKPVSTGDKQGTLSIKSNAAGSPHTIDLTGAGIPIPECSDGKDNDGNGKIDMADPDCHSDFDPTNLASYAGNFYEKTSLSGLYGFQPLPSIYTGNQAFKNITCSVIECPFIYGNGKNIVVVVHGWNSNPTVWANDLVIKTQAAIQQLPDKDKDNWVVLPAVDWHEAAAILSDSPTPYIAYVHAEGLGVRLGKSLAEHSPKSVHFIAHSAGSNFIQSALESMNKKISETEHRVVPTHMTFLDAYTPFNLLDRYGDGAKYAEHYFSQNAPFLEAPFTSTRLPYSINYDVTNVQADINWIIKNHAWPINYYANSVNPVFNPGFPYSLESGRTELPDNAPKTLCTVAKDKGLSGNYPFTCIDPISPKAFLQLGADVLADVLIDTAIAIGNSQIDAVVKSATGVVEVLKAAPSWPIIGVQKLLHLKTGSPAWVSFNVNVVDAANVLVFDYDFPVESNNGLFSVFVDGGLIYVRDETLMEHGKIISETKLLPIPLTPGKHSVGFRLDPLSDKSSEIFIANARFGMKTVQKQTLPADTLAPSTQISITGTEVITKWFASDVTVSLMATDAEGGVENTQYSLDNGSTWMEYKQPFTISSVGEHTIQYHSRDWFGNLEAIKSETFKINKAPLANAGSNQNVRLGSSVTLNGSASSDPDNGPSPLSFFWTQAAGNNANLSDSVSAYPKFSATVKEFYTFDLVVNDGLDNSTSASVKITVPALGDIDLDGDVDSNDLAKITAVLNKPANGPNDLRDINGDMKLDALDTRKLVLLCTRPRCATQ